MTSDDATDHELERTAYQEWHGLEMYTDDDGVTHATIPYDEKLTNPFGVVNGSVIGTLVDVASGKALRETFADPESGMLATVDLNVTYLDAATDDLHGEITIVYAGGSIGVTRAEITCPGPDGEPNPVAVGQTIYRLFREST